jgi:putative endonuclease
MSYYLYILKSLKDGRLYVGVTGRLEQRIKEHNFGMAKATRSRRPLALVWHETHKNLSEARQQEWFLKNTPQGGKLKKKLALGTLGPSSPKD